ncbi:MAG: methyltransferase domain-containing protein [Chloroflexota bacterium]
MTKQSWNPESYVKHAGFVAKLGMPVVELLNPKAGERILDIGCGDGLLTIKLVEMGCEVVGIDGSAEQIGAAKTLGLDAYVMDGQALTFDNEFDAVFTNAALHWMKDPDAVISGVWQALRQRGGRFVGEFGGGDNVGQIKAALFAAIQKRGIDPETLNPWYFPSTEEYQIRLEAQGFVVDYIELIPRPTPLPGDISGWLETFAESFTAALPVDERPDFVAEIREALRPTLCDAGGNWTADYVRLRFAATKPAG